MKNKNITASHPVGATSAHPVLKINKRGNKYLGSDAGEFFAEEARRDPEFATMLEAEVERLEKARSLHKARSRKTSK